jgi:hypothetical protein
MTTPQEIEKLRNTLNALVGAECWGIVAGAGTGSVVSFEFGAKRPLKRALSNTRLPEVLRRFEGEYGLMVECAWRLESHSAVVGGWTEGSVENGKRYPFLHALEGRRVVACSVEPVSLDLRVEFDAELALRVFCDQTSKEEEADNYSLHTSDATVIVGCKSILRLE